MQFRLVLCLKWHRNVVTKSGYSVQYNELHIDHCNYNSLIF